MAKPNSLVRDEVHWLSVIGRGLSLLAMHGAGLGDKELVKKAKFLCSLGLTRKEAADLLDTSEDSLSTLFSRANKKSKAASKGRSGGRK